MSFDISVRDLVEAGLCVCGGLATREMVKQAFDAMDMKSLKLQIGRRVIQGAMFITGVGMTYDICRKANNAIDVTSAAVKKIKESAEGEVADDPEEVEED